MMQDNKRKIPVCPLLSAGSNDNRICMQENCAWYMANTKMCAMFIIAHNNMLEIKTKQGK